ncbi:MAG: flagellar hook-basal body complex protein FliE [Limisphaerales bacterium]
MDPISAMRFAGAGGVMPGALQNVHAPKISTDELQGLGNISTPQPSAQVGRSFSDFLGQMVQDVNAKQANAAGAVEGVLTGQNVPLHQAMIAMEEASVSFQLMVEVRNKLLESYQELMRMQI